MFALERRAMDYHGQVISFLDRTLPSGRILDIGAGNGFRAARLSRPDRIVLPMEPDPRMVDVAQPLIWAQGVAQDIPFHDGSFDGAYSTWAFFFDGIPTLEQGLREVRRVVRPGAQL
jgi:SAM-dependent methyltransferase